MYKLSDSGEPIIGRKETYDMLYLLGKERKEKPTYWLQEVNAGRDDHTMGNQIKDNKESY